jgi:hypothetical protein
MHGLAAPFLLKKLTSELRQALLAFVEEMSLKVNVEFDKKTTL